MALRANLASQARPSTNNGISLAAHAAAYAGRTLRSRSMWAIGSELAIVGFLLVLNGALAMAEMAMVSARRSRLRTRAASGDKGAAAALDLLAEPTRFLSTVQIGITLIGILLGAVSGATLASELRLVLEAVPGLASYAQPISLAVVVALTTYLSLVIGELVPKRIAQNAPEAIASAIARPMRVLATITAPLVAILTLTTEGVLRVFRVHASGEPALTEEDVRLLIVQGTEAGVIQAGERQVVEAAFELGDREVRELMTPRVLVTWLDLEAGREAAVAKMANNPHRYYPVCQGELDRVAGVLAARDLMPRLLAGGEFELAALLRPPLFLPERLPAYSALDEFKRAGTRMALVSTNRAESKACSPRRICWKSWLVSRLGCARRGAGTNPPRRRVMVAGWPGARTRSRGIARCQARSRRVEGHPDAGWDGNGQDRTHSNRGRPLRVAWREIRSCRHGRAPGR